MEREALALPPGRLRRWARVPRQQPPAGPPSTAVLRPRVLSAPGCGGTRTRTRTLSDVPGSRRQARGRTLRSAAASATGGTAAQRRAYPSRAGGGRSRPAAAWMAEAARSPCSIGPTQENSVSARPLPGERPPAACVWISARPLARRGGRRPSR